MEGGDRNVVERHVLAAAEVEYRVAVDVAGMGQYPGEVLCARDAAQVDHVLRSRARGEALDHYVRAGAGD